MNGSYQFNDDQSIVKFYPNKKEWKRKYNPMESFFATVYPTGALHFQGKISLDKFLKAFQLTLNHFEFLFARNIQEGNDLYTYFSNDLNKFYLQLELEQRENESIKETNIIGTPEKIDQRMLFWVMIDNVIDLPIGAFKLTILKDGFILGYCLNHAFFDHASTFYFLKFLSHVYTHGTPLKEPQIINIEEIVKSQVDSAKPFNNLDEVRMFAENMVYQYSKDKSDLLNLLSQPYDGKIMNFELPSTALKTFREKSSDYFSDNDIIHALLFKILASDNLLPISKNLKINFVCNMRKKCNLGENAIGTVFDFCNISLPLDDIRKASITELALVNRKSLSLMTLEKMGRSVKWYQALQKLEEQRAYYVPDIFDPFSFGITNWTSFDYDEILFEGAQPITLKTTPLPPQTRVIIITFDQSNNEKFYTISLGVPNSALTAIKALEKSSNLFTSA